MTCPGGVGLHDGAGRLQPGLGRGRQPADHRRHGRAPPQAGCLLVLGPDGQRARDHLRRAAINGPWDMTAVDHGATATLFVTNVLNGTVAANGDVVNRGTVVRIRPRPA